MSSPSLLKRFLGAIVGAISAVILYGMYDIVASPLQAYISQDERSQVERRYNVRSFDRVEQGRLNHVIEKAQLLMEGETGEKEPNEAVVVPPSSQEEVTEIVLSPREQRIAARVEKSPPFVPFPEWLSVPEGKIETWKEYPPPSSFIRKKGSNEGVMKKEIVTKSQLPASGPAVWALSFIALFLAGLTRRMMTHRALEKAKFL